jgi:hypothetical protein
VLLEASHSLREPGPDNAGSKVVPQSPVDCGRRDVGVRPPSREYSERNAAVDSPLHLERQQRFALRGGQEFTAWHATILITNSAFENSDRSDFRDSMTSLILDGGTGPPHRIPSSRYNSAEDSLRFIYSSP